MEFRDGAVPIIDETGTSIAQVARGLGPVEATLGTWVKQAREAREGDGDLTNGRLRGAQAASC
ncbi:MAG: transposase [Actinobacteria bacterium]|nr:transposase [Actinomycetota bacterium]